MTVVRPGWLSAIKLDPTKSGPERYAPPDRRPVEKQTDINQVALLRRQSDETASTRDLASENLNTLIQRVAGGSMDEIDRVMRELEGVRDLLRNEGQRVSREIAGYVNLNRASMNVMKVIADSIQNWKGAQNNSD